VGCQQKQRRVEGKARFISVDFNPPQGVSRALHHRRHPLNPRFTSAKAPPTLGKDKKRLLAPSPLVYCTKGWLKNECKTIEAELRRA
jgi:hypothetical protein